MTHLSKNALLIVALVMVAGLFAASECDAANYYVDSVKGNDRSSGRSAKSPWKSHKRVESAKLRAGDVVHFKRGSAFSGSMQISASGTKSKPIRLTAYGEGELPKFTNSSTRDLSGNAIRILSYLPM